MLNRLMFRSGQQGLSVNLTKTKETGWTGCLMRKDDGNWTKRLTMWIPLDMRRNQGRQRRRWVKEMKVEGTLW